MLRFLPQNLSEVTGMEHLIGACGTLPPTAVYTYRLFARVPRTMPRSRKLSEHAMTLTSTWR